MRRTVSCRRERAAVLVDVLPVRIDALRDDARAELLEDLGRDAVGRPLPAVDDHLEAVERQVARERVLHEDVVAPDRVVDAERLADRGGRRTERVDRVREHEPLDLRLDLVGQLEPRPAEELDAVVLERVVGGGDDHPGVRAECPREERDPGRGERTDEQHVDAHRADAGRHRGLEHVAGEPRVLADQDLVPVRRPLAHVGERPPETERRLRRHGLDVRDAAYAVGTEEPSPHHRPPSVPGATRWSVSGSGRCFSSSSDGGRSTRALTRYVPGTSPAASTYAAPSARS